ncbi:uncharacterized protein AMSG_00399 [Thecamonas trahens ATCC 50062]|uniref:Transmembrane protein n=1 Tax=Thecamonas trahens ATCC 50062 TaxID=461836 RepID=A0A0L0D8D3_THETB|nr:hypothetical protein AMSG_00399 [Thecamonas trahens ATCC 50062]KNC48622.1 hypothetical protein AMSG_00399 [Thecamonas trahens ATCC 50062]|eukprot:XP_013762678.1 hypothetical protein AMSG_00399 [Thecamonas trahens ATCC 50062]
MSTLATLAVVLALIAACLAQSPPPPPMTNTQSETVDNDDPAIGLGLAIVACVGVAGIVCLAGYCSLKRDERKLSKMEANDFHDEHSA